MTPLQALNDLVYFGGWKRERALVILGVGDESLAGSDKREFGLVRLNGASDVADTTAAIVKNVTRK